jgi:pimeloyl-ACP methyl ester carboxylesterase
MFKPAFVSLVAATACATSDKPVETKGGAMSSNVTAETSGSAKAERANSEAAGVAFVASGDGTKIAFERTGKGPALVIVSGALSQRKNAKALAGKLSERFTVYTYDRRGRGESGDTKPYAVEREIEDLGAVIAQAGGKAYVYGVSSGAALALRSAGRLGPEKVSKLALYEPPYGQDERDFSEQKQRVDQLVQTGKPGDAAAYFFSAIGTPPQAVDDMKRSPDWRDISEIDFTLAYDYAVLGDGSVPESVGQITIPTLVMTGEKSMGFMRPTAERIAKLMPKAQHTTVKGQTHQASPEVVAPLLFEFFGDAS